MKRLTLLLTILLFSGPIFGQSFNDLRVRRDFYLESLTEKSIPYIDASGKIVEDAGFYYEGDTLNAYNYDGLWKGLDTSGVLTSTPTLQEVTDAGNSTSNSITAAGLNSTANLSVDGTGDSYFQGDISTDGRIIFTEQNQSGSGNIALDLSTSSVHDVTLTGDATLGYLNPQTGTYIIKLVQDATGGHTVTWTSLRWQASGGSVTIDDTAGATTILSCFYDEDQDRMIITEIGNLSDL